MYKASKEKSPPSSASVTPTPIRSLSVGEFAAMTQKHIEFWCRKLNLSPNKVFSLSDDELDQYLAAVYGDSLDDRWHNDEALHRQRLQRFKKLVNVKRHMEDHQNMIRQRAGGLMYSTQPRKRSVFEILHDAALQIDFAYGKNRGAANLTPLHGVSRQYYGAGASPANLPNQTASVHPNVSYSSGGGDAKLTGSRPNAIYSNGGGNGKPDESRPNVQMMQQAPIHYENALFVVNENGLPSLVEMS